MSEIVYACPLPEGDFYITDIPFFGRIRPDKIDEFFGVAKHFEGSLVELLLNRESTVIYHIDFNYIGRLGDESFLRPVLLGANYHKGHSEGRYKIIVQNVFERKGPWVLFRPPGSNNKTFYLQDVSLPGLVKPEFGEVEVNPLKIRNRYLHRGNSSAIFE